MLSMSGAGDRKRRLTRLRRGRSSHRRNRPIQAGRLRRAPHGGRVVGPVARLASGHASLEQPLAELRHERPDALLMVLEGRTLLAAAVLLEAPGPPFAVRADELRDGDAFQLGGLAARVGVAAGVAQLGDDAVAGLAPRARRVERADVVLDAAEVDGPRPAPLRALTGRPAPGAPGVVAVGEALGLARTSEDAAPWRRGGIRAISAALLGEVAREELLDLGEPETAGCRTARTGSRGTSSARRCGPRRRRAWQWRPRAPGLRRWWWRTCRRPWTGSGRRTLDFARFSFRRRTPPAASPGVVAPEQDSACSGRCSVAPLPGVAGSVAVWRGLSGSNPRSC
jgi:hypothetical protein